ncbi:MAG: twin-arginine translocase subunit TatC [Spirochaetaceae bacterium]|nr:twin-arginine translocase subunit TatC [Spirochaetaceae bacterium]|tara:strand:+ start:11265 stop:12275 length:1011 start_codon:yes stop_codon:yes gene_type:complete
MAKAQRPSGKKTSKAQAKSSKKTGKKKAARKKSSVATDSRKGSSTTRSRTGTGQSASGKTRRAVAVQSTGNTAGVADSDYLDEQDPRERYMSLGDHLEELRKRLLWIIGVVIFASVGFGIFSYDLHSILVQPFKAVSDYPLLLQAVAGPLDVVIRLSLLLGILSTAPIILWILWGFVTPAVSRKVAWIGHMSVLTSGLLFWGGVVFTWFNLFPISLEMFFKVMLMGLENTIPQTTIEKYYSFLFMVHMGAGLIFQVPLLIVALGALGILTVEWHKKYWRFFITAVFILSAIITPPDPLTQSILAGPIIALYAIAVGIVWLLERSRRKKDLIERELR